LVDTIRHLGENIGRIFRYILPGVVILGGSYGAYPSLFPSIDFDKFNLWHLFALGAITIVAGNTWYAFHRYGIHQTVDMIFYAVGQPGPSAREPGLKAISSYADDLARYVVNSFKISPDKALRQHVALRASAMHLMYISSEVSLIFALLNEPNSFFNRNSRLMIILGLIGLVVTIWQNFITRRVDWYSIEGTN